MDPDPARRSGAGGKGVLLLYDISRGAGGLGGGKGKAFLPPKKHGGPVEIVTPSEHPSSSVPKLRLLLELE